MHAYSSNGGIDLRGCANAWFMQRAAAEQVLKAFQEHPDAWTRVDTVLEKAKTQQTKFFALQVNMVTSHNGSS